MMHDSFHLFSLAWALRLVCLISSSCVMLVLQMVAINQNHYPERLHRAFVFNAPSFVGAMWKLVEPLLGPGTKYKIRICTNLEVPVSDHNCSLGVVC